MLKIGLTGGIGSGKSTIASIFDSVFNIPIIDADIIAHQLVKPGQPAVLVLKKYFGRSIVDDDGRLNRKQLRDLIFSNPAKKKQVEDLLHPLIYQQMNDEFSRQSSPYSIFCIPLLMETKMEPFVDRVLVVDCSVNCQIKRVVSRDKLSNDRILSIIDSQVSRDYRISHADDVVDNSKSATQLAEQVKKLHNQYLSFSNC